MNYTGAKTCVNGKEIQVKKNHFILINLKKKIDFFYI